METGKNAAVPRREASRSYRKMMRWTMEQYAIKGGSPLVGEVEIGGAKNAALGLSLIHI